MSEDCSVHVIVGRILHIEDKSEVYYPKVSCVYSKLEEAKESELTPTIRQTRRQRGFKMLLFRLGTLATTLIVVVALTLVGVKIAGFKTFTVMSGSMEPKLPVGSLIYVKPTDYKTLKVGDVISYVANNDKTVVTHRIVAIEPDAKDSEVLRFKTQGDANASADANLVHYKNVLGTPVVTIPYLGYIAHSIQQPPGIYITLVVGTLLLAWTFLPGTLEERRKTARKSVAKV
ncbi:signal peptidase I [Candidatus Saccharibacteria bacterium]|nr:signal peptidase I [Candidatus Saccharibacteria bacterium]